MDAEQYDAWAIGFTTSDEFGNAEILYDATLPKVKAALESKVAARRHIPVVTGFLGRGHVTNAITTLGRGGSDLTATVLGAALQLEEVQVWKDVDGECQLMCGRLRSSQSVQQLPSPAEPWCEAAFLWQSCLASKPLSLSLMCCLVESSSKPNQ